jgi:hypothetical protein
VSSAALPATSQPTAAAVPTATLPPPIQPALLGILPASVGSSAVREDVEREAEYAADPGRGTTVVGFAAAVVGDAGANIATVAVARLDSSAPVGFFERWRADFDDAACAANDGIAGREARQIGGRAVEVTRCAGGAIVYHARLLQAGTLIVSILSIGGGDFGTLLIEEVRE